MKIIINELEGLKNRDEVQRIISANSDDWTVFTNIVSEIKNESSKLSNVILGVFYYSYCAKTFWPDNSDPRVDSAVENGFLTLDEDEKNIEPNLEDPKVKRLSVALKKLKLFLDSDAKPEFFELFQNKNDYQVDIKNRRLWQNYLGLSSL